MGKERKNEFVMSFVGDIENRLRKSAGKDTSNIEEEIHNEVRDHSRKIKNYSQAEKEGQLKYQYFSKFFVNVNT
jgi:hypothetical protein